MVNLFVCLFRNVFKSSTLWYLLLMLMELSLRSVYNFFRSFSSIPPLCLKNSSVLTDIFQSNDFTN